MLDIAKLDPNFSVESSVKTDDTVFYDVKENLFCLYGLIYEDGHYRRMPKKTAEGVSRAVCTLNDQTAGGRVRFVTDSPFVSIAASMPVRAPSNNQSPTGSSSFDLFVDGLYSSTFVYPMSSPSEQGYVSRKSVPRGYFEGYCGERSVGDTGMHEITIHFPLYHEVCELRIGLHADAKFLPAPEYSSGKRAIVYGSSITQGGCASIPGLAYSNILAMRHGIDLVNLGFSGNARGECAICDYIAEQNPDIFIMDYDHNAPTLEHLKNTHERFFLRFREKCPDTPVILLSAPNFDFCPVWFAPRRRVVMKTYQNAIARGDQNVYFVDGKTIFGKKNRDLCTLDGTHPNDIGHLRMANGISRILEKLI